MVDYKHFIPFDSSLQKITNAEPYTFEIIQISPHFDRTPILTFLIDRTETLTRTIDNQNHIYDYLSSIRHFLRKSETHLPSLRKLLDICLTIYGHYAPDVSSEAPEGAILGDRSVVAWRSIKEVSLLLGDLAGSTGAYGEIGDVFLEIFSKARHRGVFEQAFFGFEKLCESCWR